MANMTVVRPGQINGAGDDRAMFLKVFAGEILSAFTETNVAMSRHVVRTITGAKSAQFPATWKATAGYHVPGVEITGGVINGAERVINIDDMLYSSVFMSDIDEAMSHFDFRSEYSRELGAALARHLDKNVLQVGLLAARASSTVTGGNGGIQVELKIDADPVAPVPVPAALPLLGAAIGVLGLLRRRKAA